MPQGASSHMLAKASATCSRRTLLPLLARNPVTCSMFVAQSCQAISRAQPMVPSERSTGISQGDTSPNTMSPGFRSPRRRLIEGICPS